MISIKTITLTAIFSFICLGFPDAVHAQGSFSAGITAAQGWAWGTGGLSALAINTIILNITSFLVGLVSFLALLGIVVGGIMYVVSIGNEQRTAQAKKVISYSLIGLLVVLARWLFAEQVFLWTGTAVPAAITPPAGLTFTLIINNIISFIQALISIVATLLVIIGGFMYLTSAGDDQKTARAKKTIFTALAGLLIAIISGTLTNIITGIANVAGVPAADVLAIGNIIFNIIAFVLSFMSIIAVAAFVYGGITYLTSGGSDEKTQRGKKIIIYAVVGIIVIMISATVVNIVIAL